MTQESSNSQCSQYMEKGDILSQLQQGLESAKIKNRLNNTSKLNRTKHAFPDDIIEEDGDLYNWVAMDGGKYLLSKEKVILTSIILREKKKFFSSLVPHIRNDTSTIFYCDVDYLGEDETIEDVIKHIQSVLTSVVEEELLEEIWITRSESKQERYHIYIPNIIVKKDKLMIWWNDINAECAENGMKGKYSQKHKQWKLPVDTGCNQGIVPIRP